MISPYLVNAEVPFLVAAPDEERAEALARSYVEMLGESWSFCSVHRVRRLSDVPSELHRVVPLNGNDTLFDMLEEAHVEFCEDPMCSSCNKLLERRY